MTLILASPGPYVTRMLTSPGPYVSLVLQAYLAAMLRARPALARSALFVDPICFLLYRREVLYNFLYRRPTLRRSWWRPSKWFALALHRMLTQEPSIQSCFRRDFWWSQVPY